MAQRSVNSQRHKKVCKNDRQQPDDAASDSDNGSMPLKPGRYGVYGDSLLSAGEGLGNWLQDLDWFSGAGGEGAVTGASISALGVYLLVPQSL